MKQTAAKKSDFPFAAELITDVNGRISKVIVDVDAYWKLIEALEDEGLHRAMQQVKDEPALSREEALAILDQP